MTRQSSPPWTGWSSMGESPVGAGTASTRSTPRAWWRHCSDSTPAGTSTLSCIPTPSSGPRSRTPPASGCRSTPGSSSSSNARSAGSTRLLCARSCRRASGCPGARSAKATPTSREYRGAAHAVLPAQRRGRRQAGRGGGRLGGRSRRRRARPPHPLPAGAQRGARQSTGEGRADPGRGAARRVAGPGPGGWVRSSRRPRWHTPAP